MAENNKKIDAARENAPVSVESDGTTGAQTSGSVKNDKKKRTVAILIAAACAVCVVGMFFLNSESMTFDFDFFGLFEPEETQQHVYSGDGVHRISLYDPDWESDIFENRRWLDLNRYITYVEGGMALTLVDGDYAAYGEPVEMLADYCDALMHGDAERLNSFYTDSYFTTHDRWERITMQKLYNIKVEYISHTDDASGNRYVYKLTYMIMENDGTFRDDLVSDAERPQFYTIIEQDGELRIDEVAYKRPQN